MPYSESFENFTPNVVIPLPPRSGTPSFPSDLALISVPVPLTPEQWTHLLTVLNAMHPGLVESAD